MEEARHEDHLREADRIDPDVDHRADDYTPDARRTDETVTTAHEETDGPSHRARPDQSLAKPWLVRRSWTTGTRELPLPHRNNHQTAATGVRESRVRRARTAAPTRAGPPSPPAHHPLTA